MEIELDNLIEEVEGKIFVMECGKEYAACPACVEKDIQLYKDILVSLKTLKQILKPKQ